MGLMDTFYSMLEQEKAARKMPAVKPSQKLNDNDPAARPVRAGFEGIYDKLLEISRADKPKTPKL